MSALIHHFVIHQLAINAEQKLSLIPRPSCIDVTADIESLAAQINQAFNAKPGKGVGGFGVVTASDDNDEEDDGPVVDQEFRQLLADFRGESLEFTDFSVKAAELLKRTLVNMGTIETGYIVFSHYEFLATRYLMIALLDTKEHVEIDQQMELSRADILDLAKMQLAVRIDLTQLDTQAEQNRYISFIKGRMGRKVSDFFMAFIGCEEQVDVKQQNKQLMSSVDEYLAAEELDPSEKHQQREVVAQYYKEKLDQGEDIQIKELAEKLPKEQERDFYAFSQQAEQPLEEQFQADKGALKTLAKFSGQGGGVSLSFDRKLFGDRITYHADSDTLMIKGIPPNLKDQLTRN